MTSKEALSKLWVGCVGKAMIEEHNAVLKDLEKLENIRKIVHEAVGQNLAYVLSQISEELRKWVRD